ncbi:hypothetical protein FPV67DRAFT_1085809 [Lyophyllum atratum]|nr:hypothetical protein FPV67DRAFT_1085809 [Lyophyllum atratum]
MTTTGNPREYLERPLRFLHPLEPQARRSDYIVPFTAQDEFREMRRTLLGDMDRLSVEIMRVQALLSDLMSQRDQYVTRVKDIDCAIAPHKRLPPEILSLIFSHCVYGVNLPRTAKPAQRDDLWRIGGICSRWRQIVFNTPILWYNLTINGPRPHDNSKEAAPRHSKFFHTLEAAQQITPLGTRNLEIAIDEGLDGLPISGAGILRRIIAPYSTQFKTISLSCPPALLNPLVSSPTASFLALETLCVQYKAGSKQFKAIQGPELPTDFLVFEDAPKLRHFTWNIPEIPHHPIHTFRVRWSQLRYLSIALDITTTDVHLLLSQCTRLENCRLNLLQNANRTNAISPNLITMPYLQCIHLNGRVDSSLSLLINLLILPSLVYMLLEGPVEFDDLATLVIRSNCQLEVFGTSWVHHQYIERFLQTVSPTLKALTAGGWLMKRSILESISNGTLLPHLEWICLGVQPATGLNGFAQLVNSRWGNTTAMAVSDIHTAYASTRFTGPEFHKQVQVLCKRFSKEQKGRIISACYEVHYAPRNPSQSQFRDLEFFKL